jgi:hypothetical protein
MSREPSGSSLIDYIAAAKAQGAADGFLVDMLESTPRSVPSTAG